MFKGNSKIMHIPVNHIFFILYENWVQGPGTKFSCLVSVMSVNARQCSSQTSLLDAYQYIY